MNKKYSRKELIEQINKHLHKCKDVDTLAFILGFITYYIGESR